MTAADVFRAVRARWLLFALCCLLPVAAGLALSLASKPDYLSTAELFVSAPGTANAPAAYQGALLAQQQAPSFARLATSPAVTRAVIADLRLTTSPAGLAEQVSASSPQNSVVIDVTARASSAAAAQSIANDTAVRLAAAAERLSEPRPGGAPRLRLSLTEPATLPAALGSHRKTDLVLGLIVGLAAAFTAVILRERADRRVRTVAQARSATGSALVVPTGGPHQTAWSRSRTAISAAESFRRLRIGLLNSIAPSQVRSLAVTSLTPDGPGPAVAANLALALAEGGASVALVDTDPRSCRIAEYFGVDGSVGVTTVVSGATPLSAAAQRYNGRLFILPAGPAPAMVPQAASPTQLRELVDRLGQAADQIVVHVAPVLADARSAELCAAAGPVVLAVRANRTRQADLSLTAEILGGAKATLAAVVLATARLAPLPSAFQADGPLPKERPASSANGGGRAAPERTPSFHAAAAHQRNHGA